MSGMADYINRQTIIEAIHSAIYPFFCGAEDGDILSEDEKLVLSVNKAVCTAIKALPSAERKGHWMKKWHTVFKEELPCCSECNNFMAFRWNYCPNCGARMDTFEGAMNPQEGE